MVAADVILLSIRLRSAFSSLPKRMSGFSKSAFTSNRMEEALKMAQEKKKPVACLYTNTATTCPLASGATEGFLEAVGK